MLAAAPYLTADRSACHYTRVTADPCAALADLLFPSALEAIGDFRTWLPRAIEQATTRFSSSPAICEGTHSVSYGELAQRVQTMERRLVDAELRPHTAFAVITDSAVDVVVAFLAGLRLRLVVAPLSTSDPPQRLARLIGQLGPSAIVLGRRAPTLPTDSAPIVISTEEGEIARVRTAPPARVFEPGDAYVFFTSGSTGLPQGVVGTGIGLGHYVAWEGLAIGAQPGWRYSQVAPLGFDAIIPELFVPLTTGGTVCVPPKRAAELSSERLAEWLREERITVLDCVPSLFSLVTEAEVQLPALRFVMMAGESPHLPNLRRWLERGNRACLYNCYGLTESTVINTLAEIEPDLAAGSAIPAGQAIHGFSLEIVDETGNPVAPGQIGEVWIVGEYVARGYLDGPGERFRIRPGGTRLVATGDLGFIDASGHLVLGGRRDRIVKSRGQRVDLHEVERALQEIPAVRDAVVVADAKRGLVAAIRSDVRANELPPILDWLAQRLPSYMVPHRLVVYEAWPRGRTDKIDIAQILSDASHSALRPVSQALTAREEFVATRWREVLNLGAGHSLGPDDDFIACGGDSLAAMALADQLGGDVQPGQLLRTPTLRSHALLLASADSGPAPVSNQLVPSVAAHRTEPDVYLAHPGFDTREIQSLERIPAAWNLLPILRIDGLRGVAQLVSTLGALVERHIALRSWIRPIGEGPPFGVRTNSEPSWVVRDMHGVPPNEVERHLALALAEAQSRAFRLDEPLFRAWILDCAPQRIWVLLCINHAIADEWSIELLVKEIFCLLDGDDLPPLRCTLPELTAALWSQPASEFARQARWWRGHLDGATVVRLAQESGRSSEGHTPAKCLTVSLSAERRAAVRARSITLGVTARIMFLTAWFRLAHRLSGRRDLLIVAPELNRFRAGSAELIGSLFNYAAWRVQDASTRDPASMALLLMRDAFAATEALDVNVSGILHEVGLGDAFAGLRFNYYRAAPSLLSSRKSPLRLTYRQPPADVTFADLVLCVQDFGEHAELILRYREQAIDERLAMEWMQTYLELLGET